MDTKALEANLKWRGIALKVFDTKEQAAAYLTASIKGKTVGFGGSMTLEEMGLYEKLKKENTVYWHWREEMTGDEAKAKAYLADVYITSLNGVAETGELVNIDGSGNRVAATLTKHDAEDDAVLQALILIDAGKRLTLQARPPLTPVYPRDAIDAG